MINGGKEVPELVKYERQLEKYLDKLDTKVAETELQVSVPDDQLPSTAVHFRVRYLMDRAENAAVAPVTPVKMKGNQSTDGCFLQHE
jgi:hypothetical protein